MGFVHIELNTNDLGKAQAFYKKVFGWKYMEMPMPGGTYAMVADAMNPGTGLQNVPMSGIPSQWVAYIEVSDVKKTVAKAVAAGATATVPYFEAGEHGAGAWLVDPTGATIAIWRSNTPPKKKATKRKAKKKTAKKKATKRKTAKKKATKRKTTKRKATKKKATKKKATKKKATKRKATKKKATKRKAAKKKVTKRKAAKKKSARRKAKR